MEGISHVHKFWSWPQHNPQHPPSQGTLVLHGARNLENHERFLRVDSDPDGQVPCRDPALSSGGNRRSLCLIIHLATCMYHHQGSELKPKEHDSTK